MENGYNGWKNRETWNVALWINNDEPTYRLAQEFMNTRLQNEDRNLNCYISFICRYMDEGASTPDGVDWLDRALDWTALDEMMRELID